MSKISILPVQDRGLLFTLGSSWTPPTISECSETQFTLFAVWEKNHHTHFTDEKTEVQKSNKLVEGHS